MIKQLKEWIKNGYRKPPFLSSPPYHELYRVKHEIAYYRGWSGLRTDANYCVSRLGWWLQARDVIIPLRNLPCLAISICAPSGCLIRMHEIQSNYGCMKSKRMLARRRSSQSPLCGKRIKAIWRISYAILNGCLITNAWNPTGCRASMNYRCADAGAALSQPTSIRHEYKTRR